MRIQIDLYSGKNWDAMRRFYEEILRLKPLPETFVENGVEYNSDFGGTKIILHQSDNSEGPHTIPLWVTDFDDFRSFWIGRGMEFSEGKDGNGEKAIFMVDPNGNVICITQNPYKSLVAA